MKPAWESLLSTSIKSPQFLVILTPLSLEVPFGFPLNLDAQYNKGKFSSDDRNKLAKLRDFHAKNCQLLNIKNFSIKDIQDHLADLQQLHQAFILLYLDQKNIKFFNAEPTAYEHIYCHVVTEKIEPVVEKLFFISSTAAILAHMLEKKFSALKFSQETNLDPVTQEIKKPYLQVMGNTAELKKIIDLCKKYSVNFISSQDSIKIQLPANLSESSYLCQLLDSLKIVESKKPELNSSSDEDPKYGNVIPITPLKKPSPVQAGWAMPDRLAANDNKQMPFFFFFDKDFSAIDLLQLALFDGFFRKLVTAVIPELTLVTLAEMIVGLDKLNPKIHPQLFAVFQSIATYTLQAEVYNYVYISTPTKEQQKIVYLLELHCRAAAIFSRLICEKFGNMLFEINHDENRATSYLTVYCLEKQFRGLMGALEPKKHIVTAELGDDKAKLCITLPRNFDELPDFGNLLVALSDGKFPAPQFPGPPPKISLTPVPDKRS